MKRKAYLKSHDAPLSNGALRRPISRCRRVAPIGNVRSLAIAGFKPGISFEKGTVFMTIINKLALALAIVGCLNWGLVGLFSFDLVAWLFGGAQMILSRIVYTIIALAGIWCIALLFHTDERIAEHRV